MPSAIIAHREGPYEDCTLERVDPLEPPAGHAVVRVLAGGLALGDVLRIEGRFPLRGRSWPFIPGQEICGEVVAIGEGVKRLKVGDLVFGSTSTGSCCEEAEVQESQVHILPPGVDPIVAAGFELNYGTSWHALVDVAHLQAGETLLVLGAAGGVGAAAVDIGKALGATVIACASSDEKLQFCKRAGADYCIDYERGDLLEELERLGLRGAVDVVYDPVGGKYSEPALRSLQWRGRFVVIGAASGRPASIPLTHTILQEWRILGSTFFYRLRDGNTANAASMELMMHMVQEGRLKPVVSTVYPLDVAGFRAACEAFLSRQVMGKVCLQPRSATSKL